MKSDIVIIGGGASGLMAAYGAARVSIQAGRDTSVTVLEKMPRPGRKIMITGKGRCNFTNLKDWNDFSVHVRSGSELVKNAFYNFPPRDVVAFMESSGMPTVIERGDRAFPASYHASDVVDTLVRACNGLGVKIVPDCEVRGVELLDDGSQWRFNLGCADGGSWLCKCLIVATGGLSYPATGSTGDGYAWAQRLGHSVTPLFPSLTALVPAGYKLISNPDPSNRLHIDRSEALTPLGEALCGVQLKNVGVTLLCSGREDEYEFGDIDFTDGGIEGPVGFQLSRKAVKAMLNGEHIALRIDLKNGVDAGELEARIAALWSGIEADPRSRGLREKEKCRILLGKLMPWDLIPAFRLCHPSLMQQFSRGRQYPPSGPPHSVGPLPFREPTPSGGHCLSRAVFGQLARSLQNWRFEIEGYVGYERAVITAGGINSSELSRKTLESRRVGGLYFCGEILDVDSDTGGYNLQTAFCSGLLAGESAARSLGR